MAPEAVGFIAPYLNAATVDFKGSGNPKFHRDMSVVPSVEPTYEALKALKSCGVDMEVTNLLVPKYGESMKDLKGLAGWVRENLGSDTPFHILRFHPDYQLVDIPATHLGALEEAYRVAKEAG